MSLDNDNRAADLYFDSNKTEDKETEYKFVLLYLKLICEPYYKLLVVTSSVIGTHTIL